MEENRTRENYQTMVEQVHNLVQNVLLVNENMNILDRNKPFTV